ncbi:MAG: KH domain-containing protein [Bacilli bacterium]|nr:KH domain-containing protein [Bacilli bacterium]MDD4795128.1 KH domain-containing protein [Bacilli bacterium]
MELFIYKGKDKQVILDKALSDLNLTEGETIFKYEDQKSGLFKSLSYQLSLIKLTDIEKYLKDFLGNLLNDMGINTTFESNIRNKQITIKMFSDNNAILIGKNGQTLSALTLLAKQTIFNHLGMYPYINLDVENYKDKQVAHLERLAKNIAREVRETKTPVVMENMNSYERRIVHNILNNFKGIKTESEGEEPNRHIIVKPRNE